MSASDASGDAEVRNRSKKKNAPKTSEKKNAPETSEKPTKKKQQKKKDDDAMAVDEPSKKPKPKPKPKKANEEGPPKKKVKKD